MSSPLEEGGPRAIYFGSLEGEIGGSKEGNGERRATDMSRNFEDFDAKPQRRNFEDFEAKPQSRNSSANEEFERRALARRLKIPTSDATVRSLLVSLNQPVTLFGEGPGERRDRLKLMASRAITSLPRALELFPTLRELCGRTAGDEGPRVDSEDDEDEEFYVPGSINLVKVRSFLLDDSIARRRNNTPGKLDHVAEISARNAIYSKLNQDLDLSWSWMDPNGRPLATCTFTPDGNLFTGDWSGRLMKYHVADHSSANYTSALIDCAGDRITAMCSNDCNALLIGTASGKISFRSTDNDKTDLALPTCHAIKSLNWHPSNRFFASTSSDSLWRLWDAQAACEVQVQEGHLGGVSAGAWHPDGALYCTGGTSDGIVRVWDCRLGKAIWTIYGADKCAVTALAFSSHLLASSDSDGFLKFHDLRKLQANYLKTAAHRSCCSGLKFVAGGRAILTAGFDGAMRIWSPGDLRLVKEVQVSGSKVTAFDALETGKQIRVAAVTFDRNVKIFS